MYEFLDLRQFLTLDSASCFSVKTDRGLLHAAPGGTFLSAALLLSARGNEQRYAEPEAQAAMHPKFMTLAFFRPLVSSDLKSNLAISDAIVRAGSNLRS